MKNRELFEKTVGILVNAYQNDTLGHGDCNACAVGNIVAANCSIENIFDWKEWDKKAMGSGYFGWARVFMTSPSNGQQDVNESIYSESVVSKFQIDSTGYTWQELAKIEHAFETAPRGGDGDDWMFNGLLAVYDVLCEIHEVNKEEVKSGEEVFQLV